LRFGRKERYAIHNNSDFFSHLILLNLNQYKHST